MIPQHYAPIRRPNGTKKGRRKDEMEDVVRETERVKEGNDSKRKKRECCVLILQDTGGRLRDLI